MGKDKVMPDDKTQENLQPSQPVQQIHIRQMHATTQQKNKHDIRL